MTQITLEWSIFIYYPEKPWEGGHSVPPHPLEQTEHYLPDIGMLSLAVR